MQYRKADDMKLSVYAAIVKEFGHLVRWSVKDGETKVFPLAHSNNFLSIKAGPVAMAGLEKTPVVDTDLKVIRIGGNALKDKGVSLTSDAIVAGPKKLNGELQYSTWPMQIVIGHKDAEAALRLSLRNMLGIKEEVAPTLTPEQEESARQAAVELMAS